jgi:hypothetical protein
MKAWYSCLSSWNSSAAWTSSFAQMHMPNLWCREFSVPIERRGDSTARTSPLSIQELSANSKFNLSAHSLIVHFGIILYQLLIIKKQMNDVITFNRPLGSVFNDHPTSLSRFPRPWKVQLATQRSLSYLIPETPSEIYVNAINNESKHLQRGNYLGTHLSVAKKWISGSLLTTDCSSKGQ